MRAMDRYAASPEALPPLELRPLRDLDLTKAPFPDQPPHLSAASGIVRRGVFAYVIGDDLVDLGVFDLSAAEPGELRRVLSRELVGDESERQSQKPDLEGLTSLPPFAGFPHGGLLGLGSGSAEGRDHGFFWGLASDGSLAGEPREVDLAPVYSKLRAELGEINVEGASVLEERLWIFNRGNSDDSPNAIAEIALADLFESLTGDREIDCDELATLRTYELGEVGGTPLCFSDATPLFDRVVVFTASAEADLGDAGPDGEIRGSVVGTIDANGQIERLRQIDSRWKVEGVHAAIDTGVVDFAFVCDQDDPDVPSPLLTATMPLDREFDGSG